MRRIGTVDKIVGLEQLEYKCTSIRNESGMTAHEKLMQALYDALRAGGDGMPVSQLMRLSKPEIERLRQLRVNWRWITARIGWVIENGVEVPIPDSEAVSGYAGGLSVAGVRGTFARIRGEEAKCRAEAPERSTQDRVRDGPAPGPTAPAAEPVSPSPRRGGRQTPKPDNPALRYKNDLNKLKEPPT